MNQGVVVDCRMEKENSFFQVGDKTDLGKFKI